MLSDSRPSSGDLRHPRSSRGSWTDEWGRTVSETAQVPWFGARKMARRLASEVNDLTSKLERMGALTIDQLEARRSDLEREL